MKNSVELRQERAGLIADANTLLETCKTEARNFSEDEKVSYDAKLVSIDNLKKDIDLVERQEKLNAEYNQRFLLAQDKVTKLKSRLDKSTKEPILYYF